MNAVPDTLSRHQVAIALGERSYEISIGAGLLADPASWADLPRSASALIVTNATVAPLYAPQLERALAGRHAKVHTVVLPDGEQYKDWQTLNLIFDALLGQGCDRKTVLYALGGGVVGDMTGFAAASYMRGVPFVQVPTTLLAQVDSSVGGKTAINHPLGKNMIGAFYQPKLVLADTSVLNTLPDRELKAGLAEVIKYGLIRDLPFLDWIEANIARLLARDPDALAEAVERSCRNKAEVVAADETEQGERATLNLGHTFGHAIETGMGYGQWLHGEAVAAGVVMAADLSRRLGWLSDADVERVRAIHVRAGLPVKGAPLGADRYLELMAHDKKVTDGTLRLVLLRQIGRAVITSEAASADIRASIEACC